MEIRGPDGVSGSRRVKRKRASKPAKPEDVLPARQSSDSVEISQVGHFISELSNLSKVRQDKIEQIKKIVEEGKYETYDRLEKAVDKFLKEDASDLI